ncbi:MAG: hypothetical protein AAGA75_21650 [Cyanobacteria bacterium P01_E01_bin.6]
MILVYVALGVIVILVVIAFSGQENRLEIPDHISDEDIRQAAQEGQKIRAIRLYRTLHGSSLKAAKAAVEEMMRNE